jgi:hypothetical protein
MSNQPAERVAWVEAEVHRHAATILSAADRCPPGGNREWDGLLALYRVTPQPAVDRVSEVMGRRMTRGAVPTEVRRALESVASWARGELQQLAPLLPADPRLRAVEDRIARLGAEADRYESAAAPPAGPSVGSIFANATATAGQAPWQSVKVPASTVLVCGGCGAPQQTSLDFRCRYCASPMGATPS